MLELLALAAGLHMADPCGIVQSWRTDIIMCTVSDAPSITLAGVTVNHPAFTADTTPDAASHGMGLAKWDLGPLPTSGYYSTGVRGVCIHEDGSLTPTSAVGGAGDMFPGHYWTQSARDAVGYDVAYQTDACLAPLKRGAVIFLAYAPLVPVASDGFVGSWVVTGQDPVGVYHQGIGTTVSITLRQNACVGATYDTDDKQDACWTAAGYGWLNISAVFTDGTVDSTLGSYSMFTYRPYPTINYLNMRSDYTYTTTIPAGKYFDHFELRNEPPGGSVYTSDWKWCPTGSSCAVATSGGYTESQAFVVRDAALDGIAYKPWGNGYVAPSWSCSTWACVTSSCDAVSSVDVVGMLKCLAIVPGYNFDDQWNAMQAGVNTWEPVQFGTYATGVLRSVLYAFQAHDGACGALFGDAWLIHGSAYSTCTLPQQTLVRNVVNATIYLLSFFAVWGWWQYFTTEFKAPPIFYRSKSADAS